MINLLPTEQQIQRKQERTLKLVWNIGILMIASFIAFMLMLLFVNLYLLDQIDVQKALIEYERDKSTQVQDLKTRVNVINTTLENLNSFYEEQFSSTKLLEQAESLLPKGLYLNTFLYQEKQYLISMSGFANDVKIIYQLRENLRNSPLFKDVELNLSDWLETSTIGFNVEFSLNNDI